jgi:uridine kinase
MIAHPPARSLDQLAQFVAAIAARRAEVPADRALLVGISGIDASGKGFITEKIAKRLQELGWCVATINADDWLNLPEVCLSQHKPAEHFYEHALR